MADPTMTDEESASKATIWRASAGLLMAHSLVWGLRLLPESVFLTVVGAERLLFLQGPSLALAQRTLPFFGLYLVGMGTCAFVVWRAIYAAGVLRRGLYAAGFVVLWCVWGILASAPII